MTIIFGITGRSNDTLHLSCSHGDHWGVTDVATLSLHLILFSASLIRAQAGKSVIIIYTSQSIKILHQTVSSFQPNELPLWESCL